MTAVSDRRAYVLVACVSAASIGLELLQTRLLSFLYFNHVVYLTVTVALLGFGISGVLVSLWGHRQRQPDEAISWLTVFFVASIPICLGVITRLPAMIPGRGATVKLLLSYVGLTIPFLCSGAVLGWLFMTRASRINRLYAVDLVFSSIAVVAFLVLLQPLGANAIAWACSGLALAGFAAYSQRVIDQTSRLVLIGGWIVMAIVLRDGLLGNRPEAYKTLGRAYASGMETATLEATYWTPTTRIDVLSDTAKDVISRARTARAAETKLITQDADAFTVMLNQKRVAEMFETVKRGEILGALSLTYRLNPEPADSLVIGVGGGIDIVTARVHGARQITAVEINPATVALDSGRYRDFLQWPSWAGVSLVRGEGRNYVRGKQNAYDTIVMSAVDTFAALNSGAYVMSENYLYTVEAVDDYLRALKSDGTMAIYRWFFLKPRESLRLAGLYQAAAEKAGIAQPGQSIMVIAEDVGWSYRWAVTLIKKRPFTAEEVRNVLGAISTRPEMTAIYVPDVLPPDELRTLEAASAVKDPASTFAREKFRELLSTRAGGSRSTFFQEYPYRIDPVYDDRPFFFEYFKPGRDTGESQTVLGGLASIHGPIGYYILYALLGICSIVCVTCILLPLWIFQRQGLATPGAIPLVLYFACLGAGFMLFEVGAMQVVTVYIGDPAVSLAVVLAGLLLATGVGAFVVSRYPPAQAVSVITSGALIIAAAICGWLAFAHFVQPRTMHFGLPARIAIVLLGLLPIGALLGLPFPTAIRAIEEQYPRFIAWAWGVNGVTSVLASIISILIAMRFGFSVVVLIAAVVYLLALVSFRAFDARRRRTGAATGAGNSGPIR